MRIVKLNQQIVAIDYFKEVKIKILKRSKMEQFSIFLGLRLRRLHDIYITPFYLVLCDIHYNLKSWSKMNF